MREILFRGKRTNNGEWIEGYVSHIPLSGMNEFNYFITNGKLILNKHITYCATPLIQVEPSTVGQYTELTDKNGTKIFEGDIIKCSFSKTTLLYIVRFNLGEFKAVSKSNTVIASCIFDKFEVIGNIHDNPELLGV